MKKNALKKTISLLLTVTMLVCAVSLLIVPASAQKLLLEPYTGFGDLVNGRLEPSKNEIIMDGKAGTASDDTRWFVPAANGNAIPVIDGVASAGEGYEDFEDYEEYLYLAVNRDKGDDALFTSWYNQVKNWDLIVKWCWDGVYLYFYFEYTIENYICQVSTGSNLWQWNCIQFGVANLDATGDERSETGYGVSSAGNCYTACWGGSYFPIDNTDYVGTKTTKRETTTLKHEFRIDLAKALDVTSVSSGDKIRLAWSIMSDNTGSGKNCGVNFCMGISFEDDGKAAEHFGVVTLSGDVEKSATGRTNYYTPDEQDLQLDYSTASSLFFADITESNDFTSKNDTVTATYHGEDTVKYMNLNSSEAAALYYSAQRYPVSLWASNAAFCPTHAVIRYRTSSEGANLGLNFVNVNMSAVFDEGGTLISEKGFKPENVIYPTITTQIIADGEWHYAVYQLTGNDVWQSIIESMGIAVTGNIDVEGVRFFAWDPSEKYDANFIQGGDIDDPDEDDQPTASPTPKDDKKDDGKTDDGKTEKKGCKSMALTSAAFVLMASFAAGALTLKKKEN